MKKSEIKKLAARYPKFVEWSEEDQVFIGRCPMLFAGGLHGRDEAAVYKELCETAEEWVETLQKDPGIQREICRPNRSQPASETGPQGNLARRKPQ